MQTLNSKRVVAHESRIGRVYPILRFEHTSKMEMCPHHGLSLHAPALDGCIICAQQAVEKFEDILLLQEEEKQLLDSILNQTIDELEADLALKSKL